MTAKIWTCLTKISKMPTLNGTRNSGKKTSIPSPAVLQHNVYTNALLKNVLIFCFIRQGTCTVLLLLDSNSI